MGMERALARVVSRRSQEVLDAYIIEKIKRDEERSDSQREPLRHEPPPPLRQERRPSPQRHKDSEPERGVVVIDF